MFLLEEIQRTALTGIAVAAVLCDLYSGRIPNAVTATGAAFGFFWQLAAHGPVGLLLFLGGAGLPVLLLGGLYFFRMIGAGDIKLLCVAGGFFGPERALSCMAWSVLAGAVVSVALMLRSRSFASRMFYFLDYVGDYAQTGKWKPYLEGVDERSRFCFSVPVLAGILCCMWSM